MARARRAISGLMTLAPAMALVRRGDDEREMPVEEVRVGDLVIVRPGGRVPVDGEVLHGYSAIDQGPVTGESWPVDKSPGDVVFAGTINGSGALDIQATRPASDSTLSRIVALVEQAQARRAPVQTFVDRFARRYTPAVVMLALAVALVPPLLFGPSTTGYEFSTWVYRAITLLVVACPCALVISTPVSIVSALTAAARAGVLIKGGAHLEQLGRITCVAFDKTGTLTSGRISVSDVFAVRGASPQGVLAAAAALEQRSEHPIGRAIVARARAEQLPMAAGYGFRALPGLGAEATVDLVPVIVGSHRLFEDRALCSPSLHAHVADIEGRGRTPVLVGRGGQGIGVLGMVDELRESGRATIEQLRAQGVRHVALLTGDRPAAAQVVVDNAAVDEAHADLLPQDKVAHIARLRASYGPVVMVGDGINDAPALAAADVGIAMGVAGTDAAIETADVALLTDDLAMVPYALRLGRATLANIRLNVAIALGLKLAFVLLAVSGLATLWMAVLADTGASILVTANSLRLLRTR
jgi:Cd2+/Zn2+-exporting ATPase